MTDIIFILVKPLCPVHEVGFFLQETTPLRIERLHHRIRVISRNNFALMLLSMETQTKPAKCLDQHNSLEFVAHLYIIFVIPRYKGLKFIPVRLSPNELIYINFSKDVYSVLKDVQNKITDLQY